MRTKTLFLTAAAVAAGIISASAQVYSVNVVGYVNTSLVGGTPAKYTLVNNPLDNKVSNAYSNILGTLPVGSQVLKWTGSGYSSATRALLFAGWLPNGSETNTLVPGEGAFVRTPVGSAGFTNTYVGEVLQGALTNGFPNGYSLEANQVPVAGDATTLGITATVPATGGSQLLKWNSAGQTYQTFNRSGVGAGWLPSVPSIAVGDGFFIRNLSGSPVSWNQNFTVN